jgi:hypothetical protein
VRLSPLDEASVGTMLLRDIKSLFDERETDRLSSSEIVEALAGLEGRPWAEWKGGKPMSKNQLAGLLRPFCIIPDTVRIGTGTAKGYYRHAYDEAFDRFLTPLAASPSSETSHRNNASGTGTSYTSRTVTAPEPVTVRKCEKSLRHSDCYVVTDEKPPSPDGRVCAHCGQPETPGSRLLECSVDGVQSWGHEDCLEQAWRNWPGMVDVADQGPTAGRKDLWTTKRYLRQRLQHVGCG